jgi:ABC-type transport system involved in multi-copper enzyme maturation permease subunit
MWALIKREIEDQIVFFIAAALLTALVIITTIVSVVPERLMMGETFWMAVSMPYLLIFVPFVSGAVGATQMYSDRTKKISAFLCTQATNRPRILTAKIIAGIMWICTVIVPVAIKDAVLLWKYPPLPGVERGGIWVLYGTALVLNFTCYCLGLMMGWNAGKTIPILGSIVLTPVVMLVILIKGFGAEPVVLLAVLAAAMLVRTWHKFMATEL